MSLRDWFAQKRKKPPQDVASCVDAALPEDVWTQCYSCQAHLLNRDLDANLRVCPECQYHFRVGARERVAQLLSDFVEVDAELAPVDPLAFEDTQPYLQRQKEASDKSGLLDAIITGVGKLQDQALALGVMDFSYMGGSMGSVVGEKITRLAELALAHRLPLVIISASGGARMQEGTFSLMQMVKTGAVLARLHEAGLLYVSVLTEPTFGGVTASYGTLGDVIIAESAARIGFAGRRVIEQTIRQKLPGDFQTASYAERYGQVDVVLSRSELAPYLATLIRVHQCSSELTPVGLEKFFPEGPAAHCQKEEAPVC
ncbi:MAG: acetyl-CoA carboxylase, carboxyltransferase subunit beta [Candidatus Melainabacteria bacterium]|nr:acetyl-CoA carboxylase, carboxyltransferase subunit beta [Candidatus Melainabacteria bacterium]